MKVKALFISILIALSFIFEIQAQAVRSYVGIVRSQYSESQIDYWNEIINKLEKDYTASYINEELKEQSFGSGFIYVAADGSCYAITNAHVVPVADKAKIEFEEESNGEKKTYKDLEVIARDEELDLAILKFPNGEKEFAQGLSFSNKEIKDGDDVYSAGYPGLNIDPVWQFGKGNVTNAKIWSIKELMNAKISYIIQHSATVDPGNSGGPLLVQSASNALGYEVIGINTWKAAFRQAANYSIPSQVVINFINKTLHNTSEEEKSEELKQKAARFAEDLNTKEFNFYNIEKYISDSYTTSESYSNHVLSKLKKSDEKYKVLSCLREGTTRAFRLYRAEEIFKDFSTIEYPDEEKNNKNLLKLKEKSEENQNSKEENIEEDKSFFSVSSLEKENNENGIIQYKVIFSNIDGGEVESHWIIEKKSWKLTDISYVKKATKESNKENDMKNLSMFIIGSNNTLSKSITTYDDETEVDFDINHDLHLENFHWFSFIGTGFLFDYQTTEYDTMNLVGMDLALRIPVNISMLTLHPFAKAGAEFAIFSDDAAYGYFYEAGAELILHKDSYNGFGVGGSVKKQIIKALNYNSHNYDYTAVSFYLIFLTY
ncbi:MAG: serine protease [Treponema sp.]|nr:serine protease [Treponema sp.]